MPSNVWRITCEAAWPWASVSWLVVRFPDSISLLWDLPGGPVAKNLPCSAGDTGSITGQGTKIPHTAEQLSPHATKKSTPQIIKYSNN